MIIRFAMVEDVSQIADVYNHSIDDTLSNFTAKNRTYSERLKWFEKRDDRYKILVACEGNEILGFAALEQFSSRHCYDLVAELAVYISPQNRNKGIAKALLEKLIKVAQSIGFYQLTITLFEFNHSAIKLYKSVGFEQVGVYENLGYYQGELKNIFIFSKKLVFDEEAINNYYQNELLI